MTRLEVFGSNPKKKIVEHNLPNISWRYSGLHTRFPLRGPGVTDLMDKTSNEDGRPERNQVIIYMVKVELLPITDPEELEYLTI